MQHIQKHYKTTPNFSGDELGKDSHLTFMEMQYTNTHNIIQCFMLIQVVISNKHLQCHFDVRIKVVKSN
jgi:hypothetical protein